ncbi:hypothetical protein MRB53_042063 [Persea americana]|nr:hypothetical protein MRB53_042063 [Persea americana]
MDEDDAEYDEEAEEELDLPQTSAFLRSTNSSPRGLKRSRDGQVRPASQMALVADGLLAGRKHMHLVEAPSDIVRCENIIQDSIARVRRQPSKVDAVLADTSSKLTAIWNETADLTTKPGGFGRCRTPTTSPLPDDFDLIHLNKPSPSANEAFWDYVGASTLTARLDRVIRLLKDAGWEHADCAIDDGAPTRGYTGRQLENTEEVVARCTNTLEQCPVFRLSLGGQNIFQRSFLDSTMSLSTASRRAESRVPWTVLENLRAIYGVLLGSAEGHPHWGARLARSVDILHHMAAADSLARVTTKPDDKLLSVNTMDLLQVGLALVLDDGVATVIECPSHFVAAHCSVGVSRLALLVGWLPSAKPQATLGQGFSKEDLLVLSHAHSHRISRLIRLIAMRFWRSGRIADPIDTEGWELAIAVLNRQDQSSTSTQGISELLASIDLSTEERVDKALSVCDEYGLDEQRRNIAERYADSLTEEGQPHSYGAVLIYYARANATSKLKSTLALLTSLCLLHSTSVPTPLSNRRQTEQPPLPLASRAQRPRHRRPRGCAAPGVASERLCTLRKFYDLRDQDLLPPVAPDGAPQTHPPATRLRPLARKRQAATALFGIIQSASDCISGGLFDPTIEAVVPIDGLLALFGELLPFLGTTTAVATHTTLPTDPPSHTRILSQHQVFTLLSILEDFLAAPTRIRDKRPKPPPRQSIRLPPPPPTRASPHPPPPPPPKATSSSNPPPAGTSSPHPPPRRRIPPSCPPGRGTGARAWPHCSTRTSRSATDAHAPPGQAAALLRVFREALCARSRGWMGRVAGVCCFLGGGGGGGCFFSLSYVNYYARFAWRTIDMALHPDFAFSAARPVPFFSPALSRFPSSRHFPTQMSTLGRVVSATQNLDRAEARGAQGIREPDLEGDVDGGDVLGVVGPRGLERGLRGRE